ncbi:MAG TPA: protein kinase, partial [Ktedonobacteraceae bacterium]|nr:protein kinase [Ktedonobacteraceae bacterium]
MGDAGPQRISHYAIIRLLNEGPISYTYLGKDEQRKKRYVILKVFNIPLSTKAARESFLTHARQLKKLKRSNITEIQNFGIIAEPGNQQDFGYLVIEYIEESAILKQFAPGQSFAPDEIKPFLSAIADTLQYAHVSHILHGNLHPGNILLGERLRITDFSPMPQELLQPFNHLATRALLYKAPEYLRGTLTSASDQYSLAVIVYEWLCGQRPYTATGHDELLYQQEHEQIPSPRSSNSKISSNVEAVILKALSPQPADRFEHMLKFSDAYLRALMGFPLTKNIERKQVVSPVNPPAINTTHISNRKNENEITHAKKRDEGAIHPTLTGANAYEGDTAIIRTFGTVKPKVFKREDHSRLHQVVATDLSHGGILSERLDGYEERQAQIEMAILVARSLIEERHVIVEAATGTGKSLAYLLPIVRSGKVAIISTANKALQEQLFYKDIPFVKEHIQDFEAALVKGMGNYICLDRLEKERIETQPFLKNPDFTRLMNIV